MLLRVHNPLSNSPEAGPLSNFHSSLLFLSLKQPSFILFLSHLTNQRQLPLMTYIFILLVWCTSYVISQAHTWHNALVFFLLLLTNENTVLHRVLNPAGDQVQILWSCALTIFSNQAREHLYLFLFALIFQKFICFLFPVLARICCNISCTLCPSLKTASSVLCHPVPPISLTLHLSIPVFVHPSIPDFSICSVSVEILTGTSVIS